MAPRIGVPMSGRVRWVVCDWVTPNLFFPNRVDAASVQRLFDCSRSAGPLLSFGRVMHTSAGIFLPQSHHESKGVAV